MFIATDYVVIGYLNFTKQYRPLNLWILVTLYSQLQFERRAVCLRNRFVLRTTFNGFLYSCRIYFVVLANNALNRTQYNGQEQNQLQKCF